MAKFLKNDTTPNELADYQRYCVGPPYKLTNAIWSESDQKYGWARGKLLVFFSGIWLNFFK